MFSQEETEVEMEVEGGGGGGERVCDKIDLFKKII